MYDELAMEASREADEIATRLQMEVGRIRVEEWDTSMKVIASRMREGYAGRLCVRSCTLHPQNLFASNHTSYIPALT